MCVCVQFNPKSRDCNIMKIWTFKIYLFCEKLHAIPEKQKLVHSNILSSSQFIKILIIRTDKSVFFKSMLRHVKRVTHWKPTQKFKFKLVNIFKSYSQHNQVFFRNVFCFISSKLYLIFTTQWLICAAPIHCKIYRTVLIFEFNEPFTRI